VSTITGLKSTLPARSDAAELDRNATAAVSRVRLLVPTDGSPQSDAAVTVARALARRDGRELELLTAYEPAKFGAATLTRRGDPWIASLPRKAELWAQIEQQRQRLDPSSPRWRVRIEEGHPARVISRIAKRGAYQLVVMGRGAHGLVERSLRAETALRTIRWAEIPVLAVAPGTSALPRSALVAMDFSVPAIQAARAACALLGETGRLILAYVKPGEVALGEPRLVEFPDAALVETLFDDLRKALPIPPGVSLETVMLSGDPAQAILTLAHSREVDLIAAGSHGYSALERALLGSVSTALLRRAGCSVLVAPPLRRRPVREE
jgi:nucleotide-binding universal stress UspA family protein